MLKIGMFLIFALIIVQSFALKPDTLEAPKFEVYQYYETPVINETIGKNHGLAFGFEGGFLFKTDDGKYHLFPTELPHDIPGLAWDIHTTSHHWESPDGINNWTQKELLYNSTSVADGQDRHCSVWAPVTIYDDETDYWNLFYVGYACHPGQSNGTIFNIVSESKGKNGFAGPYTGQQTVIIDEQMGHPESWEGYQGDDSFHAWRLDNGTWMGFYGSHGNTAKEWYIGLMTAEHLNGPWIRCPWLNPVDYIEKPEGVENPITTRASDIGTEYNWFAVYDALMPAQIVGHNRTIGLTQSRDGVHWSPHQYLDVFPNKTFAKDCDIVRTPQGLVPEPDTCKGCYSTMFTCDGAYSNEFFIILRNLNEA